jgi:hypothetical protein
MTLQPFRGRHDSSRLQGVVVDFYLAVAMPSTTELQLGVPLFLFALVTAQTMICRLFLLLAH